MASAALALYVAGPRRFATPQEEREAYRRETEKLVRAYGAALGVDATERKFLKKRTTAFQKREIEALVRVEAPSAPLPRPVLTLEARPGARLHLVFGLELAATAAEGSVVNLAGYSQSLCAPQEYAATFCCSSDGVWLFQVQRASKGVRTCVCSKEEEPRPLEAGAAPLALPLHKARLVIEDVFIGVNLYN